MVTIAREDVMTAGRVVVVVAAAIVIALGLKQAGSLLSPIPSAFGSETSGRSTPEMLRIRPTRYLPQMPSVAAMMAQ